MKYEKGFMVMGYREGRDWEAFDEEERYELSENQAQFCNDAMESGLEIRCTYSGRGMNGNYCPAVKVEQANDLQTTSNVKEAH